MSGVQLSKHDTNIALNQGKDQLFIEPEVPAPEPEPEPEASLLGASPTRQLSTESPRSDVSDLVGSSDPDPRLRLLPGVITLSLINKELQEVEATLRASRRRSCPLPVIPLTCS